MAITFDPVKRDRTLREPNLGFVEAELIFTGEEYTTVDDRRDYGETRYVTFGWLRERIVVVVWTPRDGNRHIISMRKCNEREKKRYQASLG